MFFLIFFFSFIHECTKYYSNASNNGWRVDMPAWNMRSLIFLLFCYETSMNSPRYTDSHIIVLERFTSTCTCLSSFRVWNELCHRRSAKQASRILLFTSKTLNKNRQEALDQRGVESALRILSPTIIKHLFCRSSDAKCGQFDERVLIIFQKDITRRSNNSAER